MTYCLMFMGWLTILFWAGVALILARLIGAACNRR